MKKITFLVFVSMFLMACGGGSSNNNNDDGSSNTNKYSLNCSSENTYSPVYSPVEFPSTMGSASTTIIVMHGKRGTPYSQNIQPFQEQLTSMGYDVIFPYMPHSGLEWAGTLCEGMNYLDDLVVGQQNAGKNVIIAGHSMGAMYALAYGVTTPTVNVLGIIASAPGHLIAISSTDISDSISQAKMLIENNDSTIHSFNTIGLISTIDANARSYLSHHDLAKWPSLNNLVQSIKLPTILLDGREDRLYAIPKRQAIIGSVLNSKFTYKLLDGNHTTVIPNEINEIIIWINSDIRTLPG